MKHPAKTLCSVFAASALLIVSAAALNFRTRTLDTQQTKAAVTVMTTEILGSSQFAHHPLDDELAGKFLDGYLDLLDGGHLIFLQSDVEDFAKFRPILAESMRSSGDSSPAQIIFQRYLERLDQRAAYDADLLKSEKFDFAGHDHYTLDRKDMPRPQDMTAAHELWKQNLQFEFLQEKLAGKKPEEIPTMLSRRSSRLVQTMKKMDENAVLDLYLNALAHVYDPHSDYMDREQFQSFGIVMNHSLVGIGATLQSDEGYCKVGELVPGGPAARGGVLKTGDRIVGVSQGEGKAFTDLMDMPLPQVVDLIRGAKGTPVLLEIIPAGAADNAARKTLSMVRDTIKIADQQAKARIVELPAADHKTQRLGVIDLPGFYAGTDDSGVATSATADVSRLVRKLTKEGVSGIILDLRHNGGGSLEEAINLTGLFIPAGPVVQTRTLDGHVTVSSSHQGSPLYDGPLVVLTSRMSASASEIVAGALQDYGRALVVGDSSTFGKGTVQTLIPLAQVMQQQGLKPDTDPGALKVTISKFYRPSGQSTQLAGVKSDIVLPSLTDIPDISEAKLENPLPWDTIPSAEFSLANRVSPYLSELKTRSSSRTAQDPDFTWMRQDRDLFLKNRESNSVSLNETERRDETAATKARAEALKDEHAKHVAAEPSAYEITLENVSQPGLGKRVEHKAPAKGIDNLDPSPVSEDVNLLEAEHILSDYSALLKHHASDVVTK